MVRLHLLDAYLGAPPFEPRQEDQAPTGGGGAPASVVERSVQLGEPPPELLAVEPGPPSPAGSRVMAMLMVVGHVPRIDLRRRPG